MPTKVEKDTLTGTDTTGHEWDGLKELNTPLPKWWLYTFYATIVFGVVWMVLYPSLPIFGARGTLGWIAREAVTEEVAAANARMAPMMNRIRASTPEQIVADEELRRFAIAGGRGLFANNCAGCHGAGGQGAPGGFPSLADDEWIWGGSLEAIQHSIRHGIRSNESDEQRQSQMPAFGAGALTAPQIRDTAEYVLALSNRAADQAAVARGRTVYEENCASCHGERGTGSRDVGAPSLADQVWLYGGEREQIIRSIAVSRGGVMPAWQGRLDPAAINMLTVFVHTQLGGGER